MNRCMLLEAIKNMDECKFLKVANRALGNEDVQFIAKSLHHDSIHAIDFSYNFIDDAGAVFLAEIILNTEIAKLNLSGNNIGDVGTRCIADALRYSYVTHLDLTENAITIETATYLNSVLMYTKIEFLSLDVHRGESGRFISLKAQRYRNYLCLTLHDGNIGPRDAQYIAQCFAGNPKLELEFDFAAFHLDSEEPLSEAFNGIKISSLAFQPGNLDLTMNILSLTEILKGSRIVKLALARRTLRSHQAKVLSLLLKHIKVIDLDLQATSLGDDGVERLSESLRHNSVIKLNLSGNKIGCRGARYLSQTLKYTLITKLDLSHNNIGIDGVTWLDYGLHGSQVTEIYLEGNDLGFYMIKQPHCRTFPENLLPPLNWKNVKALLGNQTRKLKNNVFFANRISHVFKALVSTEKFSFTLPKSNGIGLDEYAFLVKSLTIHPTSRTHVMNAICRKDPDDFDLDTMDKITDFAKNAVDKFDSFLLAKLQDLTLLFNSCSKYINLLKLLDSSHFSSIVRRLLMHPYLFYINTEQKILHPFIYIMLIKHRMSLYDEASKRESIISYFLNHPEITAGNLVVEYLALK